MVIQTENSRLETDEVTIHNSIVYKVTGVMKHVYSFRY